jgi:hypothetical protein
MKYVSKNERNQICKSINVFLQLPFFAFFPVFGGHVLISSSGKKFKVFMRSKVGSFHGPFFQTRCGVIIISHYNPPNVAVVIECNANLGFSVSTVLLVVLEQVGEFCPVQLRELVLGVVEHLVLLLLDFLELLGVFGLQLLRRRLGRFGGASVLRLSFRAMKDSQT